MLTVVVVPVKPKQRNIQKRTASAKAVLTRHYDTDEEDHDDSDIDPTFEEKKEIPKSPQSPEVEKVLTRKRSLLKRSKDGISKVTKKAAKIKKKSNLEENNDDNIYEEEQE